MQILKLLRCLFNGLKMQLQSVYLMTLFCTFCRFFLCSNTWHNIALSVG